ncbi:hypothetical protein M514_05951 [Trichuris suis]|uniref:Uncharacterized protein n=1 Tax=Trichuris suis TaxID=68888 RepID=A0A085N7V0_9BILA|nr:hypothetical protein M514_05951 [Trichuris suis]
MFIAPTDHPKKSRAMADRGPPGRIVVKRWAIPRNEILLPNFRLNQAKLFESAVFGTDDNSYRFKVVFNLKSMRFRLIVLNCTEAALYGFRVELIGLYNQSLRRNMPDFRTPDNVWLLWNIKNCDPACRELVIICNVEIKPTNLFLYIHSTLRQTGNPSSRPRKRHMPQHERMPAKANTITAHLEWTIATELLITPVGGLNECLFIESPMFGTLDRKYQLKVLLNTHTSCYNLLIAKSPSVSYYDVKLRMSGLFEQTISSCEEQGLEGIVWLEWMPSDMRWDIEQMQISCSVRITPASRYVLKEMAEHRSFTRV